MKKRLLMAMLIGMVCVTGCSGNTENETNAVTEAQSETAAAETEAAPKAERPEYTALDYVTLGEYKGLAVTLNTIDVTEDEIDAEIEYQLSLNDKYVEVTEGTVKEGDVANIDYEGKKDGVAFDGGTAQGYDLTIGSNSFIDGFEDGLIGVEVGETVDLNLTFPEDYASQDLAGQEVVFTVTVNSIKEPEELTDELAAEISENAYTTVDDYREYIKETLIQGEYDQQENDKLNSLLEQVYANSTINGYPQELVDYQVDTAYNYYEEQSGMSIEEYLETNGVDMTVDEFRERLVENIQSMLDSELIMKAVAETEGIEITDEEFQEYAQKYAEQMGMTSVEEFLAQYSEGEIRISILQDKAVEIIEANAVITDPNTAGSSTAETESETAGESESQAE